MKETVRTQVRFPRHLRDWLKQQAKANSRSMNGELVSLLKTIKEEREGQENVDLQA